MPSAGPSGTKLTGEMTPFPSAEPLSVPSSPDLSLRGKASALSGSKDLDQVSTEPNGFATKPKRSSRVLKGGIAAASSSPGGAACTERYHRPRLQSLNNATPASPSLSDLNSVNAHLYSSAFSGQGKPTAGDAISSLQPIVAAGGLSDDVKSDARSKRRSFQKVPGAVSGSSTSPKKSIGGMSARLDTFGTDGDDYLSSLDKGIGSSLGIGRGSFEAQLNRSRSGKASANTGAQLRRSRTVAAGIESFSSMEPNENFAIPGRSGLPASRNMLPSSTSLSRDSPGGLGTRRKTVSNLAPDGSLAGTGARMVGYSAHQQHSHNLSVGGLSVSGNHVHSHMRDRPNLQNNQLEAKVVILGTQGVGKTSLVHRYTSGQFSASSIPSTIGASFLTKKLVVEGVKVRLQLWDTAGQERFRSMAPMYYRGSNAAVIVYDITSESSFMDIKTWIEELRKNMSSDLVVHIVGAKLDLAPFKRAVDLDFARRMVSSWIEGWKGLGGVLGQSSLSDAVLYSSSDRTPPDSPGIRQGNDSSSPIRSSRLAGLGSLAKGSASRLANFPRGTSPPSGALSSGSGSNSGGSDPGQVSGRRGSAEDDHFQPYSHSVHFHLPSKGPQSIQTCWENVEISEVSAKDDEGIEDVFLSITRKLVEKKALIERERVARERDSIILGDGDWDSAPGGNGHRESANADNSWGCCT
ncbi:ras-domain-containing protein [Violaceomyces palustris]|uniref:Ras-domain-containing protein n=1 Tax=Violaceomyces palustris TaxID=1673888 RepID=A0ACD0NZ61_9BASI|nr:ras-domain-containing protein [Violaceomyces palustris]